MANLDAGLAADGEDVPGEVDHAVADGVRVGHITATTCTEARSRTTATPTTSTAARSGVKTGRKLRWSDLGRFTLQRRP